MSWRCIGAALVVAAASHGCGGCDGDGHDGVICRVQGENIAHCYPDSSPFDAHPNCNPLTQAGCRVGEKCTWLIDALIPQFVGHIGCAPSDTANAGDACMYGAPGATGYDNCAEGLVCSSVLAFSEPGVCKQICDPQGGQPLCDAQHACVTYPELFSTGDTTPAAAGVCDVVCDPLADNDFDGSGTASIKTGMTCGSSADIGCYGYPSFGSPPQTVWTCRKERNAMEAQPTGLRHRVQCVETNNCADVGPTYYVNSCNQGYLPLLRESTMVSTAICVALCKPRNCFLGNCGTADEDRLGEAPHRCTSPDRVGTFDTSASGEHCRYIWNFEIDDQDNFLRSPTSDTLGFCFDHAKYLYDSDNNNMPDTPYPPCASLPDGFGSGSALGAGDLGCVDTTHVQFVNGKLPKPQPLDDLRPLHRPQVAP
ncbi:MAG TPA: hypothetical protein VIV11_26695 [Kofleriaceae bacterium]